MSKIRNVGYGLLTTVMMACGGHGNASKEAKAAKNGLSKAKIEMFKARFSPIDTIQSNTKLVNFDNFPYGSTIDKDLKALKATDNAFFAINKDGDYVIVKQTGAKIRKATEYTPDGNATKVTLFSKSEEQSSLTNLTDSLGIEEQNDFLVADADGSPRILMIKNKFYDAITGQKPQLNKGIFSK